TTCRSRGRATGAQPGRSPARCYTQAAAAIANRCHLMPEQQLRVPGPTPLPQRVVRASSQAMINHRGPEFAALLERITEGLRWALDTATDVLLSPASGTGGLEAAVVNVLSPGERALFCTMGSFGNRWANIGDAYGADVVRLAVEPGDAIDPED